MYLILRESQRVFDSVGGASCIRFRARASNFRVRGRASIYMNQRKSQHLHESEEEPACT